MSDANWPDGIAVAQLRIARPTDKLDTVLAFYRDGLGLPVLGSFEGHAGFDGVFLGLPGREGISNSSAIPGTSPAPRRRTTICSSSTSPIPGTCNGCGRASSGSATTRSSPPTLIGRAVRSPTRTRTAGASCCAARRVSDS